MITHASCGVHLQVRTNDWQEKLEKETNKTCFSAASSMTTWKSADLLFWFLISSTWPAPSRFTYLLRVSTHSPWRTSASWRVWGFLICLCISSDSLNDGSDLPTASTYTAHHIAGGRGNTSKCRSHNIVFQWSRTTPQIERPLWPTISVSHFYRVHYSYHPDITMPARCVQLVYRTKFKFILRTFKYSYPQKKWPCGGILKHECVVTSLISYRGGKNALRLSGWRYEHGFSPEGKTESRWVLRINTSFTTGLEVFDALYNFCVGRTGAIFWVLLKPQRFESKTNIRNVVA